MAIENPVQVAEERYNTSQRATSILTESISTGARFNIHEYTNHLVQEQTTEKKARDLRNKENSEEIMTTLNPEMRRTLQRITNGNASQWLTIIPLTADNFDLTPTQFRDALSMRYSKPLLGLRGICDGCGMEMDLNHALNCKTGGLVKQGHDQIHDIIAGLARQVYRGVMVEPIMREGSATEPGLLADIRIHGVWDRERASFYDVRVINADAASYSTRDWSSTANEAAKAKHRKYDTAAEDLHGSFTPLITSCDGILHTEFQTFSKKLVTSLAEKWDKPRSSIAGFVRAKIQLAIIRAVSLRLRGCRKMTRSAIDDTNSQIIREEAALCLEDGAPIPTQDY
ncbi:unnamed protein product [Nesidiocoris tenuis]|uniref:Uncharacterized protein n=1 Tax=Nesidiocoris tenuis TaxID=355587 RepID=A0A6H5H5U3_9HEMI|nr:unnamed protein product [Nesidiocoris tenuis]